MLAQQKARLPTGTRQLIKEPNDKKRTAECLDAHEFLSKISEYKANEIQNTDPHNQF